MIVLLAFLLFVAIPISFVFLCIAPEKQVSILKTAKDKKSSGFWRRQFQLESTKNQRIFDWIFGVILPVICFSCDFLVFNGAMSHHGALLGEYKPFAYLLSFTSIVLLMLFGQKLRWFNGVLAGLFAVGAAVSVIVGFILFPFSLIGLIVLIGALGFTPLLTAFVYTRNTIRAFTFADDFIKINSVIIHLSVVSAIFSFVLPYVFYANVENSLRKIEFGSPTEIRQEVKKLKLVSPLINVDKLGTQTCGSSDDESKTELRKAVYELSGKTAEEIGSLYCYDW